MYKLLSHIVDHFLLQQFIDHQVHNLNFFDHLENLIRAIDDENKEMHILGDLNCDMLKTGSAVPTKKLKSYELYQLS